jgi:hypothetical protein
VRQLPALVNLEIVLSNHNRFVGDSAPWPPFIPPSLKALQIVIVKNDFRRIQSFLCALPGTLRASGARLDRLEITIPEHVEHIGDGLVDVAQALRCCSPTLKVFRLATSGGSFKVSAASKELLREQWADLLGGVSACRELEVLTLPTVFCEPLFPPGTTFARLNNLEISEQGRGPRSDAGVMGLWELMTSGGLPALAKLKVTLQGPWRGARRVKTHVAPGLEAVAGTLTRFSLAKAGSLWESRDGEKGEARGYELGVAVGKLRRLVDLALDLSDKEWPYHALARGLAASGGGRRPLPLLWRVRVAALGVQRHMFPPSWASFQSDEYCNATILARLLLPSVWVFVSSHKTPQEALLTACALRQVGYKHTWVVECSPELQHAARVIAGCKL